MMPPSLPGDSARHFWSKVPSDLQKKVTSLDQLIAHFPANSERTMILKLQSHSLYDVYGRRVVREGGRIGPFEPLAYHCNFCKQYVMGPPDITDDASLDDGMILSGRRGYDVHCAHCYREIDRHTDELA